MSILGERPRFTECPECIAAAGEFGQHNELRPLPRRIARPPNRLPTVVLNLADSRCVLGNRDPRGSAGYSVTHDGDANSHLS